jgi:hypothetical protein
MKFLVHEFWPHSNHSRHSSLPGSSSMAGASLGILWFSHDLAPESKGSGPCAVFLHHSCLWCHGVCRFDGVSVCFPPLNKCLRQDLLWLTGLEAQAMIIWPPVLWACGEAVHHGGSTWQNKPCFKRGRGRKVPGSHDPLQGPASNGLRTSHQTLLPKDSTTSQ